MTYPIYLIHNTVGGAAVIAACNLAGLSLAASLSFGVLTVLVVSAGSVEMVVPRLQPVFMRCTDMLMPGRSRISGAA